MANLKLAYKRTTSLAGNDLSRTGGYSKGIAAGSTLTMTESQHAGYIIQLDTLTGSTVTLPASRGEGANHIIKVANVSDAMQGMIISSDAAAVSAWRATAGTSDTITLNRTTTGSVIVGEFIEITDVALNKFEVTGFIATSGTAATPFSATV
jgi:hypothetical protein